MVHHGDWVVAKAAGCATLDIDGLGHVDVWVTHVSVWQRKKLHSLLELIPNGSLRPSLQAARMDQKQGGLIASHKHTSLPTLSGRAQGKDTM